MIAVTVLPDYDAARSIGKTIMPELRLAVCTSDPRDGERIATRLQGATVEVCDHLADTQGFDAIMCRCWKDLARDPVVNGQVLLIAEPCPPMDVIKKLADQYGSRIAIANPDRFLASRQLIRKQLGGTLGSAGLIRLHRWEPAASPAAETNGLPEPIVRDIDVVLWLAAQTPNRVYAIEPKAASTGRYLQVHFGFAGGAMALIDYDGRLPAGDGYQSLSVIAATGAAYADDHQNMQLVYGGGLPRTVRTDERSRQLAAIAQDFADTVHSKRDFATGIEDWRRVFLIVDAIRESLQTRRAVALEGQ